MGYNTKIDWCDTTWNPVTGCYHGCKYCYARGISSRYGGYHIDPVGESMTIGTNPDGTIIVALDHQISRVDKNFVVRPAAYPYGFTPTIHRYRLNQPSKWSEPRTIFVCSMADLFGDWVPDKWIEEVFQACEQAPQHRYLFLTKNPKRLNQLARKGVLPQRHWYGYSATDESMLWRFKHARDCLVKNLFVSIEPILSPMQPCFSTHTPADWVIIGAETGNRKDKVVPKKEWIMSIAEECAFTGRPLFMKESLKELMGSDFGQEFPWEGKA